MLSGSRWSLEPLTNSTAWCLNMKGCFQDSDTDYDVATSQACIACPCARGWHSDMALRAMPLLLPLLSRVQMQKARANMYTVRMWWSRTISMIQRAQALVSVDAHDSVQSHTDIHLIQCPCRLCDYGFLAYAVARPCASSVQSRKLKHSGSLSASSNIRGLHGLRYIACQVVLYSLPP